MILTQRPVFVRDFSDVRIPRSANRDSRFFLKVGPRWYEENGLTEIWVKMKEFKRFPRAPQGLYEDIPPNFHRIWSYCYERNKCDWTPSPPHPTPLGLVWLEISDWFGWKRRAMWRVLLCPVASIMCVHVHFLQV